jgi:hypothetical protein
METTPFGGVKAADLTPFVCRELRHRLQATEDAHVMRARALDVAQAIAVATSILEADPESPRRAIARQLRGMLVVECSRERGHGWKEHLKDPRGAAATAARLEIIFAEALDELRNAGFPLNARPLEQLLHYDDRLGEKELANSARPLRCAIVLSTIAWLLTLGGLFAVIHHLSQSYYRDRSHPAMKLTFQRPSTLRLPTITVCPGHSHTPNFATGGPQGSGRLPSWPLMTISSIGTPYSSLETHYPNSMKNLVEVPREELVPNGSSETKPRNCDKSNVLMNAAKLGGVSKREDSAGLYDGHCNSCLQFRRDKPIHMTDTSPFRFTVALNRLYDFCLYNQGQETDRVMKTFHSILAENLDTLKRRRVLIDPLNETSLQILGKGDVLKAAELFEFRPAPVPGGGPKVLSVQTDFLCNVLFISGLWYPASVEHPDVSYVWDATAQYWVRKRDSVGPYWNLTAKIPRSECREGSAAGLLSALCLDAATSGLLNSHFVVYAADDESTLPGVHVLNTSRDFQYPVDSSVTRAQFKFRRRVMPSGHAVIESPAVLMSRGMIQSSAVDMYRYVSLEFSFDGLLTEVWGTRRAYKAWEYVVDILMAVVLFTGLSFFTLLMGLGLCCVHLRKS